MLDVAFDMTGQHIASASADGTARIYNVAEQRLVARLRGHEGEVSKVRVLMNVFSVSSVFSVFMFPSLFSIWDTICSCVHVYTVHSIHMHLYTVNVKILGGGEY